MSVAVVTDSTSCLDPARVAASALTVVPLHVLVGGRGRLAGREIRPGEVAEILRRGKERVTTSGVAPGEFAAAYREVAQRTGCDEVVSVHLSGGISATVEAAQMAREELAGELAVHVVDSGVVGMALGYAACAGAAAAADGASAEEVAGAVRARAGAGRTWFYVDTLEHLRRGGRIGRAQALVGSALAIKPLLTIKEGVVAPQERVRTRSKALARLVEHAVGAVEQAQGEGLEVELAVHELSAREAGEQLADQLRERTGVSPVVVELDPVVGVHTGPGTLGVVVSPVT
ncbi:DegV family protein [Ornithinimicrobium sufpigmenti]|uniref:DegV family protein n=1 Tax=Ornithinimicrobium sufpigmenti TaxID=2508882 RepID=UPI0010368598|nr:MULTISPECIES: DegV family protein [unclassified Ornithinimicrobium]